MELKTTFNTSIKTTLSYDEENLVKNIESVKASIPAHLKQYIVEQDSTRYTSKDQAVWRYILRQLSSFLSENAHECYLDGLKKTGITVDEIPSIDSMCEKLQEFGWAAVPVSGFIPPSAFMELQSLGILPIASDMRTGDHILYTPAPDIVHEAAGHAPILIDPAFANYLKKYASIAKKALISKEDLDQYEAIRELSDIKEDPTSTPEDIQKAEEKLDHINANMKNVSEAALLGRMNWWTAEYGLIGDIDNPKIYGAGLLSSLGEAKECLKDHVKKIPLTVDCVDYAYDITEPQPQLFVAKDFNRLSEVLDDLANTMAFRRGGVYGLEKAISAETVNTVELNSGLQASGQLVDILKDKTGECFYYRFEGPCQLSVGGHEIEGHNKDYHSHGFSSPLGPVKGYDECLSWASDQDLALLGIEVNKQACVEFESGIIVEGLVVSTHRTPRKELCLISFENCTMTYEGRTLFDPSWGTFDMAVGSKAVSVFTGPADRIAYGITDSFAKKRVPQRVLSDSDVKLNKFYQNVRKWRQSNSFDKASFSDFYSELQSSYPEEWLIRLELLEWVYQQTETAELQEKLKKDLLSIANEHPNKARVIQDGLAIADQQVQ